MNLRKNISFNTIKNISIDNCVVKICDQSKIESKFSVNTIQKVYLKAHKQKIYLIYVCLIAIAAPLFMFYVSLKLALMLLFLLFAAMIISEFSFNRKKYFLCIKLIDNNEVYTIPFKSFRKDEMLNIIWEIRRQQFELSVAPV